MNLMMNEIPVEGYEKVIEVREEKSGLHAFIAIHSTALGPSLGGLRIYPYASKEDALNDVLNLSKGMTYKSAMAEIGLGGGKAVIIADPSKDKTEALLLAFGAAVECLKGLYICAEDVGSTPQDMLTISKSTSYVAALPTRRSSGDPSPFTAWGCFRGIQAVARTLWGNDSVKGRTIAIQGLGAVGSHLAEHLFWHGANLIVSDVVKEKVDQAVHRYGAHVVAPEKFYGVECDILSPCAMGGAISLRTLPLLKCQAVAGSANNQLQTPECGELLNEKGILYAPDFIINAGGIINAAMEFEPDGYDPKMALEKVDGIYGTLCDIFEIARLREMSPAQVADELAESKVICGVGRREGAMKGQRT